MTKTCLDAYKNLNIQLINDSLAISPCCSSPVKTVKTLDFINNEYLNDFRKKFTNGQFPEQCKFCKNSEDKNFKSKRQESNEWYADHGYIDSKVELVRLDYWTGDTCNLRCAICGPHFSSSWKEELKLPIQTKVINKFWTNLDLDNIKFIHFNGGEPLLNKEHLKFLQTIPYKYQVHLNYNTNGSVLPTQQLIDLWSQFKLVQLHFSIDDLAERFEYQRYPAKWEIIESNLSWFIEHCPINCLFAVTTTVSLLNKHNLSNLNQWLTKNFSKNRLGDPVEYKTQPAHGLFSLDSADINKKSIVKFLDDCDSRRGTNWRSIFPELIEFIG